jgi:hypothetical protein
MKPYTFRSLAGCIIIGVAAETAAPLVAGERYDCGAGAELAFCLRPALEPWNFHTTHEDFMERPVAAQEYVASGVSSIAPPIGTLRYRSHMLIGGEERDL